MLRSNTPSITRLTGAFFFFIIIDSVASFWERDAHYVTRMISLFCVFNVFIMNFPFGFYVRALVLIVPVFGHCFNIFGVFGVPFGPLRSERVFREIRNF